MMSDTRSIECPHCKGEVHYVAALAGKRVECPICNKDFQMPSADDPGFTAPESTSEAAPRIITQSLSSTHGTSNHTPDKLPEILQELHRQTKMLAHIRIRGEINTSTNC